MWAAMSMRQNRFIYLALFLLVCPLDAFAQAAGNWAKFNAIRTGHEVRVSLKTGMSAEGFLKSNAQDDFVIVLQTGEDFRIAKNDVREIRSLEKDSRKNGTLIGLAAGIGLTVIGTAAAVEDTDWSTAQFAIAGSIVYGGIGSLLGFVIDDKYRANQVIYRAP